MVELDYQILNKALEMRRDGRTIKDIERSLDCGILHKIFPLLNREYYDNIPQKIGKTEFTIIMGKLRGGELKYRKMVENRKRGQKKVGEYFENS